MDIEIAWPNFGWPYTAIFKVVIKGVDRPNWRIWPEGFSKYLASFIIWNSKRFEKWICDPENQEYVSCFQSTHQSYNTLYPTNEYRATIPMNELHYIIDDLGLSMEYFIKDMEYHQRNTEQFNTLLASNRADAAISYFQNNGATGDNT